MSIKEIGEIIEAVKGYRSEIICIVDNCYGEFVEDKEPPQVGADLTIGSLIKNPGEGLHRQEGMLPEKDLIEEAERKA